MGGNSGRGICFHPADNSVQVSVCREEEKMLKGRFPKRVIMLFSIVRYAVSTARKPQASHKISMLSWETQYETYLMSYQCDSDCLIC